MESLDMEEVRVLYAVSYSGTLEGIEKTINLDSKRIQGILEKLEKLSLIYHPFDGDENFWERTQEGENYLVEEIYRNEMGEIYAAKEMNDLIHRILGLSDEMIDELFFRCGFIYSEHTMKALSKENLEDIRSEQDELRFTLFMETPKADVIKNLENIEKEIKAKK